MAELGAVLSKAQAATDDAEVGAHLAAAEAELSDSLDDLTRLARGLHPRELDENGLVGALRAAADRSPVPVSLDVDLEAQEVPLRTAVAAYYVCLEGLSNAVKHGQAERIHVKAAVVGAELHVEVVDGGIGGATVQGGRGLRGLVDRVEALDGSVSLESTGGQGTRLAVRLPLEPAVPGGQRSAEDTAS
jgi:signal transduction histidine kinase